MYKVLFRWAFNDSLLLRLLAFMIAASSGTKLGGAYRGLQSIYIPVSYAKGVMFLLKPLLVLRFSPFF